MSGFLDQLDSEIDAAKQYVAELEQHAGKYRRPRKPRKPRKVVAPRAASNPRKACTCWACRSGAAS